MINKQDAGIVDRLRQAGNDYTIEWGSGDLYDEAADHIEAQAERIRVLREALQRADEVLEDMGCNQTSAACRAALEATK